MKISKKVRLALRNMLLKTSRVATDKGELIFDEEELAVGVEVFVENTEGEETELVPAADGEYAEGNRVIVVSEGKVSEIRVSEEPEQPEATEIEVPAEDPIEEPEVEPENTVEERVAALEARLAEVLEGINERVGADGQRIVFTFTTFKCNTIYKSFEIKCCDIAILYCSVFHRYSSCALFSFLIDLSSNFILCYLYRNIINGNAFIFA